MFFYLQINVFNITGFRPQAGVDCVENVVTEQCGEETGELASSLASEIQQALDCTEREREYRPSVRPVTLLGGRPHIRPPGTTVPDGLIFCP